VRGREEGKKVVVNKRAGEGSNGLFNYFDTTSSALPVTQMLQCPRHQLPHCRPQPPDKSASDSFPLNHPNPPIASSPLCRSIEIRLGVQPQLTSPPAHQPTYRHPTTSAHWLNLPLRDTYPPASPYTPVPKRDRKSSASQNPRNLRAPSLIHHVFRLRICRHNRQAYGAR
jgi:hypothetical protein